MLLTIPDKAKPSKARARGKKYNNSTLVTRSKEERERLISEKVATLLTEEDHFTPGHWRTTTTLNERSNRRLAKFQDKVGYGRLMCLRARWLCWESKYDSVCNNLPIINLAY